MPCLDSNVLSEFANRPSQYLEGNRQFPNFRGYKVKVS